ncbi:MAG: hypothetical protein DWQ01_00260 [Planctomycetota bacterium]|nr:MAG: hypothetical protein DWQ01_00260 [Planctomycetota bacterium]
MGSESGLKVTPGMVLGTIILLIGALFSLDNLGVLHTDEYERYWPAGLVCLGLSFWALQRGFSGFLLGTLLIAPGGLLLAQNLGYGDFVEDILEGADQELMGTGALAVLGVLILWRSVATQVQGPSAKKAPDQTAEASQEATPPIPEGSEIQPPLAGPAEQGPDPAQAAPVGHSQVRQAAGAYGASASADAASVPPPTPQGTPGSDMAAPTRVDSFAILGGVEKSLHATNFKGGSLTAIMGGCEIDLRNASFPGDKVTIDVFTLWGGVDIQVPRDWSVVCKVVPLMGAAVDKSRCSDPQARKKLVVRGLALMGGVEIKN